MLVVATKPSIFTRSLKWFSSYAFPRRFRNPLLSPYHYLGQVLDVLSCVFFPVVSRAPTWPFASPFIFCRPFGFSFIISYNHITWASIQSFSFFFPAVVLVGKSSSGRGFRLFLDFPDRFRINTTEKLPAQYASHESCLLLSLLSRPRRMYVVLLFLFLNTSGQPSILSESQL